MMGDLVENILNEVTQTKKVKSFRIPVLLEKTAPFTSPLHMMLLPNPPSPP
jgi:hypothetical protein